MENKFKGKKAFIWVRKSKAGQSHYSQDGQKRDCMDVSKKEGLEIPEGNIYVIDETASKGKQRKEFDKMIQAAKERKINIVYIWTVDRLSRNLESGGKIEELIKENDVWVRIVEWDDFCLTKDSSPDDWHRFNTAIVQGDYEARKIAKRTKLGQKEKVLQKGYPKEAPIGYLNISDPEDHNPKLEERRRIIIKDEKRAPVVIEIFEKYATGNYSIKSLTKELAKTDFRTRETEHRLSRSITIKGIRTVLRNPFYYGEFRWQGIIWPGSHEPLISKALWDKVQAILDEKAVTLGCSRRASEVFPFKKFLQCVCGGRFTANIADGKYKYYHCWRAKEDQCPEKNYREEAIDKLIGEGIGNLRLAEKSIEAIKQMLMKADVKQDSDEKKKLKECDAHIEKEKNKLRNAARICRDDAKPVTLEIYKELEEEVEEKITYWEGEKSKLSKTNENAKADGLAILGVLSNLKAAYKRQDTKGRIRILEIVLDKCILKNGEAGLVFKEPYDMFFEAAKWVELEAASLSFGNDRPQRPGWQSAPLAGRKMDRVYGL